MTIGNSNFVSSLKCVSHWGFPETIVTKFGSMLVSFMGLKKSDRRFTITTNREYSVITKVTKLLPDVWPATSIALRPTQGHESSPLELRNEID